MRENPSRRPCPWRVTYVMSVVENWLCSPELADAAAQLESEGVAGPARSPTRGDQPSSSRRSFPEREARDTIRWLPARGGPMFDQSFGRQPARENRWIVGHPSC